MEQDDEIVGRIFSRRDALKSLGAAGFALLTAPARMAFGATTSPTATTAVNLVATPQVTEGPFFVDEKLNRSNLITGTTRASVVNGLPLQLRFTVYELNGTTGTPLPGAYVDVWHADAIGSYSDEAAGNIQSENTSGQTWLRGYQVTDANGLATFDTIYPGWYQGRTIHIHFKVRRYNAHSKTTYEFTSQLFMDETTNDTVMARAAYNTRGTRQVRNTNDGIYTAKESDGTTVGSHLMLNLSSNGSGLLGTFAVAFDSEPNIRFAEPTDTGANPNTRKYVTTTESGDQYRTVVRRIPMNDTGVGTELAVEDQGVKTIATPSTANQVNVAVEKDVWTGTVLRDEVQGKATDVIWEIGSSSGL